MIDDHQFVPGFANLCVHKVGMDTDTRCNRPDSEHAAHEEEMWWAYVHENGSLIVKPWFGDHRDYTEDCKDNPFVRRVIPPFKASSSEEARDRARALAA